MALELATLACIDENVQVDGPKLGLVASGVVGEFDQGDLVVFPSEIRELIWLNQPFIFPAMELVAESMGMRLVGTSHPGCGGAGAQGIPEAELDGISARTFDHHELEYAGSVPAGDQFQQMDGGPVAVFNRKGHKHTAKQTVLTVGGGVTHEELMEVTGGEPAFALSVDWAAIAVNAGMSPDAVQQIMQFQVGLADALTSGAASSKVTVYDAGRLDEELTAQNALMVGDIFPQF